MAIATPRRYRARDIHVAAKPPADRPQYGRVILPHRKRREETLVTG